MSYCSSCGVELADGARFCGQCGAAVQATGTTPPPAPAVADTPGAPASPAVSRSGGGSNWVIVLVALVVALGVILWWTRGEPDRPVAAAATSEAATDSGTSVGDATDTAESAPASGLTARQRADGQAEVDRLFDRMLAARTTQEIQAVSRDLCALRDRYRAEGANDPRFAQLETSCRDMGY